MSEPRKRTFRPSWRRQALFAAMALGGLILGYGTAGWFDPANHEPAASPKANGEVAPWYKKQAPPPALVKGSDPSLPAYEEKLPGDLYEPPPRKPSAPKTESPPPPAKTASPPPKLASLPPVGKLPPPPSGPLPPWLKHAAKAPEIRGRPMIALVIDDMGMDRRHSAQVVALPGPLTLAYLPYAEGLPRQTADARTGGHELMVHMPMEPGNRAIDPGPNALKVGLDDGEVRRRLDWALSRFDRYVGINNHMGSRFTADRRSMQVVMEELAKRGLLFLDSRTTPASVGGDLAAGLHVPHAERNVFLDDENAPQAVRRQLSILEQAAQRHGMAIGIGHPREATVAALIEWLPALSAKGIVLVPLTAVLRAQGWGGNDNGKSAEPPAETPVSGNAG